MIDTPLRAAVRSAKPVLPALGALVLVVSCSSDSPAHRQCNHDDDCFGSLICAEAICVPPDAVDGQSTDSGDGSSDTVDSSEVDGDSDADGDSDGDASGDCSVDEDCASLATECLAGVCDAASGECVTQSANEGSACAHGLCASSAACAAGACVEVPLECEADTVCAVGSCDDEVGCVFAAGSDAVDCVSADYPNCMANAVCTSGDCEGTSWCWIPSHMGSEPNPTFVLFQEDGTEPVFDGCGVVIGLAYTVDEESQLTLLHGVCGTYSEIDGVTPWVIRRSFGEPVIAGRGELPSADDYDGIFICPGEDAALSGLRLFTNTSGRVIGARPICSRVQAIDVHVQWGLHVPSGHVSDEVLGDAPADAAGHDLECEEGQWMTRATQSEPPGVETFRIRCERPVYSYRPYTITMPTVASAGWIGGNEPTGGLTVGESICAQDTALFELGTIVDNSDTIPRRMRSICFGMKAPDEYLEDGDSDRSITRDTNAEFSPYVGQSIFDNGSQSFCPGQTFFVGVMATFDEIGGSPGIVELTSICASFREFGSVFDTEAFWTFDGARLNGTENPSAAQLANATLCPSHHVMIGVEAAYEQVGLHTVFRNLRARCARPDVDERLSAPLP